jgi:hypothetical protein
LKRPKLASWTDLKGRGFRSLSRAKPKGAASGIVNTELLEVTEKLDVALFRIRARLNRLLKNSFARCFVSGHD